MAKRIEGITIEIDGSTTKLNDALKDTSKVISSTNSEIKALNQALKLDPTNTSLLTQKMDVLKRNISDTKDKLQTLKEAQKEMGSYSKLTDEQKSSYNALSKEIVVTENALKNMKKELVERLLFLLKHLSLFLISLISSTPLFEAASISIISLPDIALKQLLHSLHGLSSTKCSQLTILAIILAVVVFPVPLGPENK